MPPSKLERVVPLRPAEKDDTVDPREPHLGQWYWLKRKGTKSLVCAMHVGSNYVEVEWVTSQSTQRIHINEWAELTEPAPDARDFIDRTIAAGKQTVRALMGQVQQITAELGIQMGGQLQLNPHAETAGLALATTDGKPLKDYEKALVKAKDKTLPELFQRIKAENASLALWMQAELMPLRTQLADLEDLKASIKGRIFNVELYAGLIETMAQAKKGKPAPIDEPLHVFQRRHYMDEECLVDYQAGGMHFQSIAKFDKWLIQPQNFERIFPFPRTCVAFRVRRKHESSDGAWSLSRYISLVTDSKAQREADESTFLYFRNGEQLWWLQTELDFGANLFPDLDAQKMLTGQLYVHRDVEWKSNVRAGKVKVISEHLYKQMRSDDAARIWKARREYRAARARFAEDKKTYPARLKAYERELAKFNDAWAAWNRLYEQGKVTTADKPKRPPLEKPREPHEPWKNTPSRESSDYREFNKDNVHYDDMLQSLKVTMEKHNRIVLVLQGVLDRSPTLHPHPPYRLWESKDFERALKLHYDYARALVPKAPPDFSAYHRRVNQTIGIGSIVIGQEVQWLYREGEKENRRQRGDNRWHGSGRPKHRPYDDPGPGYFAEVKEIRTVKGEKCAVFRWQKKRAYSWSYKWGQSRKDLIDKNIVVPLRLLFNVSGYTRGDFKQFYEDPRTRADYMRWAEWLLESEEWHAGNRKLGAEGPSTYYQSGPTEDAPEPDDEEEDDED